MSPDGNASRRTLLKWLTAGASGVAAVLALVPGLRFLAYPLGKATVSGGDQPLRVAGPDDVAVARPLRVDVVGDLRDGWVRLAKVKLGSAWLVKAASGRVRAFSTVCPHLGCSIDWNDKEGRFDCPCHQSGFDRDGRCLFGPSPRGLDELETVATADDIKVRYRRFRLSVPGKEPLG